MEPIKDSGLHAWDEIEVKGPMSNYYPTSKRGGETKKKKKKKKEYPWTAASGL